MGMVIVGRRVVTSVDVGVPVGVRVVRVDDVVKETPFLGMRGRSRGIV